MLTLLTFLLILICILAYLPSLLVMDTSFHTHSTLYLSSSFSLTPDVPASNTNSWNHLLLIFFHRLHGHIPLALHFFIASNTLLPSLQHFCIEMHIKIK